MGANLKKRKLGWFLGSWNVTALSPYLALRLA